MDSVSALALACNVAQLVDTGIKIIKQIKEIHDRGSLSDNDEIEQWAKEVSQNNTVLEKELAARGQTLGPADIRVRQLAVNAVDLGSELKRLLNSITFANNQAGPRANALKQIVRTHLKKGQIEKISTRLRVCEATLDRTILRDL